MVVVDVVAVEPNCCFLLLCGYVTCHISMPFGAQLHAQCARFGKPAKCKWNEVGRTGMRLSLWPLTSSTVISSVAFAVLVAPAAALAAFARGALFPADFAVIATQAIRTAAEIVANAASPVFTGYYTFG